MNWQHLQASGEDLWRMRQNADIIVMLGNPCTPFGPKLWIMPLVFFGVKNSGGTEEPLCCGVIAPSVI